MFQNLLSGGKWGLLLLVTELDRTERNRMTLERLWGPWAVVDSAYPRFAVVSRPWPSFRAIDH